MRICTYSERSSFFWRERKCWRNCGTKIYDSITTGASALEQRKLRTASHNVTARARRTTKLGRKRKSTPPQNPLQRDPLLLSLFLSPLSEEPLKERTPLLFVTFRSRSQKGLTNLRDTATFPGGNSLQMSF